jgi:hypothetical protein
VGQVGVSKARHIRYTHVGGKRIGLKGGLDKMDSELVKYLVTYYTGLLSVKEKLLIKHAKSHLTLTRETLGDFIKEVNWVDKFADTSHYFNDNSNPLRITNDNFDILIASRILETKRDHIFLNYCPKCGRLARTPTAKQCRCGHSWGLRPTN